MTMAGRRRTPGPWTPRLYAYEGKRVTTYYTITRQNRRVNLGHDLAVAKRRLLELEEGRPAAGTIGELIDDALAELRRQVAAGKRAPRTLTDREAEALNLNAAFGRMPPASWLPRIRQPVVQATARAKRRPSSFQGSGRGIMRGRLQILFCRRWMVQVRRRNEMVAVGADFAGHPLAKRSRVRDSLDVERAAGGAVAVVAQADFARLDDGVVHGCSRNRLRSSARRATRPGRTVVPARVQRSNCRLAA